MSHENIWSDCRICVRDTRHAVLYEKNIETDPEFWHERDTWQVVRCLGCMTIGFRHRHDDFDLAWQDSHGETYHEFEISLYPRGVKDHKKLELHFLPALIRSIYSQTLAAYSEKAFILTGIGLRATIEAVCNEVSVSGSTLEKRIDQLHKAGFVSSGDKKRLHAIRFLGNDAAHDIKEPKESELRIALAIIDHLLNSVYILESKAKALELVVDTYEEFLPIIATCAKNYKGEQAISMSTLLDRKRRLIGQNIDAFEGRLKTEITSGAVQFLNLEKEEEIGGKKVQLYTVGDTTNVEDDDCPF